MTEELERESDLMPKASPMQEISGHIRKAGIMEMEAFSMWRWSEKAGEGHIMVPVYLRESRGRRFYFVAYDHDAKAAGWQTTWGR